MTVLAVPSLCSAQDGYTIVNLAVPSTWEADAFGGVNSAGMVAGSFATAEGIRAFVYDISRGGIVNIGTLGGDQSRANDINDAGVVVGRSTTNLGFSHAFQYSAQSGLQDIHALVHLGGSNSSAVGINEAGDIVGWADTPTGEVHAFFYNAATQQLTDLHLAAGLPLTSSSAAHAIDNGRRIVGVVEDAAERGAGFLYSISASSFLVMGGAGDSALLRISGGSAVGTADIDPTTWRGVLAQAANTSLNTFDIGALGGTISTAFDINGLGTIVGTASDANDDTRAFVGDNASGLRDLNALISDPQWYLLEAHGINDVGQIVGIGYFNGEVQVFLLTPFVDTTGPVVTVPASFTVDATSAVGAVVSFSATATDAVDGNVTATCAPASGSVFPIGSTLVTCTASDAAGNAGSASFTITVRAAPVVTWQNPVSIVVGTPLGSAQLNATANVPGTFIYTPPLGTLLGLGTGQLLSVTFTPSDTTNYGVATTQVAIDVVPAGPPAPATFHAIGDLPGGPVVSDIRDATRVGGVLYAVGASASHDQVLCISFNNPVGCVTQHNPDTALLWTFDGVNSTLTPLPDLVTPTGTPVNPLFASAITRNAAYIAGQARSNAADPAQMHAVRVTRTGLLNLDLSAAPFPANNQPAAGQAISEEGSIVYGVEGVPFRARRFDVNLSTSVRIPLLSASDTGSFTAARGASFDGSVMVGTSFVFPLTDTNGRAFRYVHSSPVGTVSAIPLLPGGTWNRALAVSPDGRTALVAGNSRSLPNGEIYLYDAVAGTTQVLGSPNTLWAPVRTFASNSSLLVNFAGMTADASVVAATFADRTDSGSVRRAHGYIHNARGWFHLTTILGEQGIDIQADGWDSEHIQINGISPDGTLVFGSGEHHGVTEGFVAEFSPGYLGSFDFPAVPPPDTSIVGAWIGTNPAEADVVVFQADGTFFVVITRLGSQPSGEFTSGFERGRYRWDPVTGAFTFATLQDTNGSVGLSGGNGVLGLTAVVSGDTFRLMYQGNVGATLGRVSGGLDTVVGGWVFGDARVDDNSGVVIFASDGTFMLAEDGDGALSPLGRDGVEAGTSSWNAGTLSFTVTLDTTGAWGVSNGPGSGTLSLPLSPDGLRLGPPSQQLRRILDPQTGLPVITSVLSTTATAGYPFAYQVAATHVPSSFGATGLPSGVSINAATGLISGTPAQAGTFNVTISASNTLSTGSAQLHLAVIAPIFTGTGTNVVVTPTVPPGSAPIPLTLQFETVTQSGVTAVTPIDPATLSPTFQLPQGFSLGTPPLYYELRTTAAFDGTITVCFDYGGVSLSGFPRLLHYETALGSWVDITTSVNVSTTTICGLTSSLSPFALASSAFDAAGFHAPIDPVAGHVNVVKGGSTVALKFNVRGPGGVQITNPAAIPNLNLSVTSTACTAGEPEEVVPVTTTGNTGLRYDAAAGQFIQNWKSPKEKGCYVVRLKGDGLLLTAKFKLK